MRTCPMTPSLRHPASTVLRNGARFSYKDSRMGELTLCQKLGIKEAPRGALWVAWPRKSSGFFTDLDETLVRAVGLAAGLTDNKIIAVDEIWSALRFVEKQRDRLPLPRGAEVSAPPEA